MSSSNTTSIWRNARIATLDPKLPGLGILEHGTIACRDGHIIYCGDDDQVPRELLVSSNIIDCERRWITPGLIDCHTHLVHAGNRANEFEMRLTGATYEEIARAGGGIASSVRALRSTDEAGLIRETLPRLDAMIAEGVTSVEIKSGYGLDLENERKTLRAARKLGEMRNIDVTTTFLGAHALPPEARGDKDAFIQKVVEMMPVLHGEKLIDAVDAFCEGIAFSSAQVEIVFNKAKSLGIPVKLHADQLSNLHGAELAARFHALSADHLEYTDDEGVRAMAKSGTVATMLPGAFYFIREKQKPPIELFRKHRVSMAVATDMNPGTSPLTSPLLTMNMAATLFQMTVDECLIGITRNAARALGRDDIGTLETGKWANLAIWNIDRPAELVYRIGFNPLWKRVWRGR